MCLKIRHHIAAKPHGSKPSQRRRLCLRRTRIAWAGALWAATMSSHDAPVNSERTVALIVAAGKGERMGGALPKQFQPVAGAAPVAHAVRGFRAHGGIDAIVVVVGAGQEALARQAVGDVADLRFCTGGDTRRESVAAGLHKIERSGGAANVLIHDAARPFLPPAVIDRLLAALGCAKGAVPVLPVVDTLAQLSETGLGDTVDRRLLARVQTPQAFRFDAILAAHRQWDSSREATDDAQIARAAGLVVAAVEGDAMLEKLTHPADVAQAEARLSAARSIRTGMGYDVHRLVKGEELWLAGVRIPHAKGLSGHSDADVAIHALVDAILGALAEGDIGSHFPPSDPKWRGAPSSRFLEFARDRVTARRGRIEHVDLTIICEAPKIGPHRDAMRTRLAELLDVSPNRVSVKATTTEGLGFAGRGEGIAAQAVATVNLPQE